MIDTNVSLIFSYTILNEYMSERLNGATHNINYTKEVKSTLGNTGFVLK